jgi:dihydroxyacetone kinase-like protein
MEIGYHAIVKWIEKASRKIQEERDYLSQLDQAIGDGDHGVNLARGFTEVDQKLKARTQPDIGALFQEIAMTLLAKVGGASGPLYSTAFLKMASRLKGKETVSLDDLAQALLEAVQGLKMRGKAEQGQKTLLDVWEPLALNLANRREDWSWEQFCHLAREQMEKTKALEAKKGRAAYLGPRSVGHLDPGAVSSYFLFEALAQIMMEEEEGR